MYHISYIIYDVSCIIYHVLWLILIYMFYMQYYIFHLSYHILIHTPFGNAELCCDVLDWIFAKSCDVLDKSKQPPFCFLAASPKVRHVLWSQGIAWGCLQTYACTEALLLAPKPQQWSFEQMAAWSVTFATTEEAFQELAPLKHLVPETEGSDMGNHILFYSPNFCSKPVL